MASPPRILPAVFSHLLYGVRDHVATITINRPERLNALNRRAYDEFEAAFLAAGGDPDVRCVVLTGADPAFCAGEDVKEMMGGAPRPPPPQPVVRHVATPAAIAAIECDKPVIVAVNGAAIGWGMEACLFADIRIASERARFSEMFIKRGLVCDIGGMWRLPAIVGPGKAAELLFTGDVIDAAEALKIGLVTEVTPHAELMERAMAVAGRIAANPPLALRYMKEGLSRTAYGNPHEVGAWCIETIRKLYATEDHKEGVASFLEKRPAVFTGR
jgi:enoyl-CoA hydratase/carnithine racemase